MLSFSSLLGRAGSLGCHLGVNWWSGKGLSLGARRYIGNEREEALNNDHEEECKKQEEGGKEKSKREKEK